MKPITDPTFRYFSSANTDLKRTFARVRREQRRQQMEKEAQQQELRAVTSIGPYIKKGTP